MSIPSLLSLADGWTLDSAGCAFAHAAKLTIHTPPGQLGNPYAAHRCSVEVELCDPNFPLLSPNVDNDPTEQDGSQVGEATVVINGTPTVGGKILNYYPRGPDIEGARRWPRPTRRARARARSSRRSSLLADPFTAAADTSLTATITLPDRSDGLVGADVSLPDGLLGVLNAVPMCGRDLAHAGACPPESQIGTVDVAVGNGAAPLRAPGKVYFSQPGGDGELARITVVVPAKCRGS